MEIETFLREPHWLSKPHPIELFKSHTYVIQKEVWEKLPKNAQQLLSDNGFYVD